jgi:hypothetical protein
LFHSSPNQECQPLPWFQVSANRALRRWFTPVILATQVSANHEKTMNLSSDQCGWGAGPSALRVEVADFPLHVLARPPACPPFCTSKYWLA